MSYNVKILIEKRKSELQVYEQSDGKVYRVLFNAPFNTIDEFRTHLNKAKEKMQEFLKDKDSNTREVKIVISSKLFPYMVNNPTTDSTHYLTEGNIDKYIVKICSKASDWHEENLTELLDSGVEIVEVVEPDQLEIDKAKELEKSIETEKTLDEILRSIRDNKEPKVKID